MSQVPEQSDGQQAADTPFIPASQRLPELTIKALLLGICLSILLSAANAYLGLLAGMTVSASIPAAVISLARSGSSKVLMPGSMSFCFTACLVS